MAGHLPFMRGRPTTMDAVGPGVVAAFGAPLAHDGRTDLAPLAMRETSAYFGSHFNANMKAAMDIDQRRRLRSAAIAGTVIELGDLVPDPTTGFEEPIRSAVAQLCRRDAIPLMLGGHRRCIAPAIRGFRDSQRDASGIAVLLIDAAPEAQAMQANDVAVIVGPRSPSEPGEDMASVELGALRQDPEGAAISALRHLGTRPVHIALDASAIAAQWHGASAEAGFDGLSLSECRAFLRRLGTARVASLSITGLDPAINGLSLVKTGQRLLLTAVLDLIYARLGVLEPRKVDDDV